MALRKSLVGSLPTDCWAGYRPNDSKSVNAPSTLVRRYWDTNQTGGVREIYCALTSVSKSFTTCALSPGN